MYGGLSASDWMGVCKYVIGICASEVAAAGKTGVCAFCVGVRISVCNY